MAYKFLDSTGTNYLWEKMKSWVAAQGYKTTDNNTWRPVVNNLTSTATDSSLSAAQGKALNDKIAAIIDGSQYVQNAIDADSALYASEAGSVAWANVTGKTNATTSTAGLMSATDKTNLDTIVNSFNSDDADTTIETIKEVLKVFESYPAGTSLSNALANKLDKTAISKLNGSAQSSSTTFYAPTSVGSNGYILTATGTGAPTWINPKNTIVGTAEYAVKADQDGLGNYITSTYLSKSGGSLNSDATLKFTMYGSRTVTISGNSIDADMSADTGTWAGSFATVKHSKGTTTMLGWYGSKGDGLYHIFMGGSYSDPAMKMDASGNFTFKNTITGTITNATQLGGVAASSYATTSALSNYLPLSGGTMTGLVTLPYDKAQLQFRGGHNSYDGVISYQTSGNEAMLFTTKNAVTSFMFVNGEDTVTNVTSSRWQALTPGLQIKNNCVAISKLITNGTTPTYNLDVGGTANATTIYENGTTLSSKYQAKGNYLTGITKDMVTTALGYTPPTTDTNTWRPVVNNLTSTATDQSLSAAQGKALNDKFGSYLPKTTYEYNKEIAFGSTGKLYIGAFPMYDSNITVEISATTSTTYNATLVIATQNINTTGGGSLTATVYGDATNTIAPNIYIGYASGSNQIHVYFSPQAWSKNLIHIQAVALAGAPSNVCTSVDSIPSTANRQPTNALTANFQAKLTSGTNIKTVNGTSLLGSGNIQISGGSGGGAVTKLWSGQKSLAELYTRDYMLHDWMVSYNFLILNVYYNGDEYNQGCIIMTQSIYAQDEGIVVGVLADGLGNTMTYHAWADSQEGIGYNDGYSADDLYVTSIYGFGG